MFAHRRPIGGQRCYYGGDRLSCEATTHFHPKSQKNGRHSDGVSKRCRGQPPVGRPVLIGQARSEVMCRGGLGAFDWGQMHVCLLTGSVCRPSAALHKAAGSYKAQREVLHPFRAENNSMTAQFFFKPTDSVTDADFLNLFCWFQNPASDRLNKG